MLNERTKPKNHKTIWFIIVLILILGFIWGQSLLNMTESAQESGFVREKIVIPIVRFIAGEKVASMVTNTMVRKAAHVIEYAVLGLWLGFLLRGYSPRVGSCLLIGLAVAVIDETIQYYTGRGSLVTDAWIDLGGVLIGSTLSLLFKKK